MSKIERLIAQIARTRMDRDVAMKSARNHPPGSDNRTFWVDIARGYQDIMMRQHRLLARQGV